MSVVLVKLESALRLGGLFRGSRHVKDLGPTRDEAVEGKCILRPAVALGNAKEKVRQFLDEVGVYRSVWPTKRSLKEVAGGCNAVTFQGLDQVMQRFPVAGVRVLEWVVVPT